MRQSEPIPPQRIVPAVDRAARMLRMLEEEQAPLSISTLARRLDASKGAVREVLETLRYHGLVARDEETKLYGLGARLIRLGALARARVGIAAAARPHLRSLADENGETALLLQIQEGQLVVHETAEPEQRRLPVSVTATPGATIPLLAGACGKVVLAFLDPEETPAGGSPTVTDEELADVRARFYAVDDEEYFAGVRGVSAPILQEDGYLIGVLLVSGLAASLQADQLEPIGEQAAAAAREISAALGAVFAADTPLEQARKGSR